MALKFQIDIHTFAFTIEINFKKNGKESERICNRKKVNKKARRLQAKKLK